MSRRRSGRTALAAVVLLSAALTAPVLGDTAASAAARGPAPSAAGELGPVFGPEAQAGEDSAAPAPGEVTRSGRHVNPTALLTVGGTPGLGVGFEGINLYQQRYVADDGNQFTVEPPDQALAVGGGRVVESVNDTISIYSTTGKRLSGPTSLNTFYGYASQFDRTTGEQGPFVTDPVSLFDPDTKRFYHVVLTLDVDRDGNLTGSNHLDLAVSRTSTPTTAYSSWLHYSVDVTGDGTSADGINLGDYPHVGADAYGFYVTTNSYSLFGDSYGGAELYAWSKREAGQAGQRRRAGAGAHPRRDRRRQAQLRALPGHGPDRPERPRPGRHGVLHELAGHPGGGQHQGLRPADQRLGPDRDQVPGHGRRHPRAARRGRHGGPLRHPAGVGPEGRADPAREALGEPEGPLDSSDSRMGQVVYGGGKLYGALSTRIDVGGQEKAGIAYYVLQPGRTAANELSATLVKEGRFGVAGQNVTYPAFGITSAGAALMTMTLVGPDYYPSSAYVTLASGTLEPSPVHVAGAGVGPQDGFSEYAAYASDGVHPRPRWGDYTATAFDGSSLWIAGEYIAQTCTYEQWSADPTCGGTRGLLANWSTRVSKVTP